MKKLLSVIACLVLSVTMMMAQKTITGRVVSGEDGEPIIGASVIVTGTTTGTVTDIDGNFSFKAPESAKTLTVSFVGMESQTVNITGKTLLVTLSANNEVLDEVVVTALGIKKSEKAVGYASASLNEESLKSVPVSNISDAMAGKIAGVSVNSTSTEPGAATSITIRGFSSLTGSNEPLWVVDGVPLQNYNVSSAWGDSYRGSGASNINQDDIESMTILKGAAATALYGSRAANGVVLVTTKSGSGRRAGKNFEVELKGGLQWSQVANFPKMQDIYGQGWDGNRTLDENGSWGPAMNGNWYVYGAEYDNSQLIQKFQKNNDLKDFFDIGLTQNYGISVSGNSDKTTYYLSYSKVTDNGIMPTDVDKYDRNSFAMRGSHTLNEYFKVSSSVNFTTSKTSSVPSYQGSSVIDGLYEMPRNISIADLKDLNNPFNTPAAYFTEYGITNPYWCIENNYEVLNQKKIFGKLQADYNPIKDLTLTYRFGFDYSDYDNKSAIAKITDDNPTTSGDNKQDGSVYASYYRTFELNQDFLANYMKKIGDFDITATIGMNINERASTFVGVSGSNLTIKSGWWHLANAASYEPSESQSKRRLVSALGDVTIGWKDMIFLDITGRNDWSSTLPEANRSFFYPGVTGSWIFTELLSDDMKKIFTFGKLRAAYGKTGNDASAYQTNNTFVSGFANNIYTTATNFPMSNGTNAFKTDYKLGSSTLKPEMTTEWELGTDLKFFNGRVGVDFSYYNRTTSDQIMTLSCDPACGYSSIVTNFGKVSNKGVEIMLDLTPVRTKDWEWNVTLNWSKNHNKVKELPDQLGGMYTIATFSTSADAINMRAVVGKEMGQIYTYVPQYVDTQGNLKYDENSELNPSFNPNGAKILVGSDGIPVRTNDVVATGKTVQNKWAGGIGTTLRYKNFSLAAQFDIRIGGYMFSRTKNLMQFTGNGIQTLYNNRYAFVIPNSVISNGEGGYVENYVAIDTYSDGIQSWFDNGMNEAGEYYLVKKDFVKLRSLSVGYDLPTKWTKACKLQSVRLSFVANNLFTWTPASNCFIDPDVSSYGTGLSGQFGELYSNPTCRRFGFNIQVKY